LRKIGRFKGEPVPITFDSLLKSSIDSQSSGESD
jgi:hypothetical protein